MRARITRHYGTEKWILQSATDLKYDLLMAGHIFLLNNKYRILEEIGKGGSSRVYLCEDVTLHKKWAVKKIDRTVKELDNGIYFLSKLSHPSIPRVVERFSDDTNNYIVTDHIEGRTLGEIIKEGALKYRDVIKITADLCDILSYLHGLDPPVIFRDLKPDNIIIGNDRRTHLVDFDTVYIEGDKRCSPFTVSKGFSPPEFAKGRCFPESDIYSLGKVIDAAGDDKAKRKLRGIIRKATNKRKEDRYHSTEEIKKELTFALLISNGRRGMILTGVALALLLVFLMIVRDISSGTGNASEGKVAGGYYGGEGTNNYYDGEGTGLHDALYTHLGGLYLKGSFSKDLSGTDPAKALRYFEEADDGTEHIEELRRFSEAMCIPGTDVSWVKIGEMLEEDTVGKDGGSASDESVEEAGSASRKNASSFIEKYGLESAAARFIVANERRLAPYMRDPEETALALFEKAGRKQIDEGRIYFDRYLRSGEEEDRAKASEILKKSLSEMQDEGSERDGVRQSAEIMLDILENRGVGRKNDLRGAEMRNAG